MDNDTYTRYSDNIAKLAQKTEDLEIIWQKNTKTSFFLIVKEGGNDSAIISIQKISSALNLLGLLETPASPLYTDNYIFQITNKQDNSVVVHLATNEIDKTKYVYLHDNIPRLYRLVEQSFDRRSVKFFDSIMEKVVKKP